MKYLTLKEVAEKFGVSTKTIGKLAAARKIPCTRATGPLRFPDDELDKWAQSPELVTARWFSGKIDDERSDDDGDNERQNLGRALFLQGRGGES